MEYRDERKTSFKLYYDAVKDLLENFDASDIGTIFKAISEYEMYGVVPDAFEDKAMMMQFKRMQSQIDIANKKYDEMCEKNRKNRNGSEKKESSYQERMEAKEQDMLRDIRSNC